MNGQMECIANSHLAFGRGLQAKRLGLAWRMLNSGCMTNQEVFNRVYAAADRHKDTSGDWRPLLRVCAGMDNAMDSFRCDGISPESEEFYKLALDSIGESIRGNAEEKELFPWFSAQGLSF